MLENIGLKISAHRADRRNGLAIPIAVSAALHIIIAALLFSLVSHSIIKEEIVEVFVLGEGGGSKPGINGEIGPPGTAAGGSDDLAELQAQNNSQPVEENKPPKEHMFEMSHAPTPKQKSDMVVHTEKVPEAAELQINRAPAHQSAALENVTAALSDKFKSAAPGAAGTGQGTGAGTGTSAGKGSAGFGTGTGGGGTGTGGILHTKFGSANAPKFLYREVPQYPFAARKRGEEGKVLLKLTIDEKGTLVSINVIESTGSDFADAAVEAVKRSRFSPAKKNNAPILCMALLPVRFTLK